MYQPSDEILKKYADVLIKFAPHDGEGIKPGETICIQLFESAKPFLRHLQKAVLEAWAFLIIDYIPEWIDREFFMYASDEQITYVPKALSLGKVADSDHLLVIRSTEDMHELDGIDSGKIMSRLKARKFIADARHHKENLWKFWWCIALYGTEDAAEEAWLSLEEYWNQIIHACFLDMDDPLTHWKEVFTQMAHVRETLNNMPIEFVHMKWEDVDLRIQIGENRLWQSWRGKNIPSFEVFTSPNRKWTEGWIRFSQPVYRYGTIIKWIELHFENGIITKASATDNEQALLDMIALENANKLGEFSLTDRRTSRITKFMADTLFDENVWGEFGNTHIAIWQSFKDCFKWDPNTPTKQQWAEWGYNESVVHTDIVSTTNRTVTAILSDGTEKIIYTNWEFTL